MVDAVLQASRVATAVAAFIRDNPDLAFLATGDLPDGLAGNSFILDLSNKLKQWGNLYPKQIDAARRATERAAATAGKPKVPVVTGDNVIIIGEIVSFKWVDGMFPGMKMVVADHRGFSVWGSVPKSLLMNGQRGSQVTFIAGTVTASDSDPSFGFFKRPKGAVILG